MLLKPVFRIPSHPFGSLFSKLGGHTSELGTSSSVVLHLVGLCKSAKLDLRVGRGLICWCGRSVTGLNVVVFIGIEARDIGANLSTTEDIVNTK